MLVHVVSLFSCDSMLNKNNWLYILCVTDYTDLAMSTVTQRQSIAFTGSLPLLEFYLNQLSGDVERIETTASSTALRVFKAVTVTHSPRMVILEVWEQATLVNFNSYKSYYRSLLTWLHYTLHVFFYKNITDKRVQFWPSVSFHYIFVGSFHPSSFQKLFNLFNLEVLPYG